MSANPQRRQRDLLRILDRERDFAVRYLLVKSLGRVGSRRRRIKGGQVRTTWYIDLRSAGGGFLWSHQGAPLRTREQAEDVLRMIQSRVAQGRSVEDAVAEFSTAREAPNAIESQLRSWLAFMRHQVNAGQRSPTYLHPLRSYTRPGHRSRHRGVRPLAGFTPN